MHAAGRPYCLLETVSHRNSNPSAVTLARLMRCSAPTHWYWFMTRPWALHTSPVTATPKRPAHRVASISGVVLATVMARQGGWGRKLQLLLSGRLFGGGAGR